MSRVIHWHERTVSALPAHRLGRGGGAPAAGSARCRSGCSAWEQPLTREMLADRVRSISYIAAMPAAERERHASEVVALVAAPSRAVPAAVPVPRAVVPARPDRPAGGRPRLVGGAAPRAARGARPAIRGRCSCARSWPSRRRSPGSPSAGAPFLDRFPTPAALAAVPAAEAVAGGRGSATTGAPSPCTAPRPRRGRDARRPAAGDLDALLALPGHRARTPPAPCWPSPSKPTTACRHQHRPRARPLGGSPARRQARCRPPRTRRCRPAGRGRGTRRCSTSAPRCAPVERHGATLSRRRTLRVGSSRSPRPDPAKRSAGVSRRAVPLRGQRPPGPRAPGRGAPTGTSRPRAGGGDGLARRPASRRSRRGHAPRRRVGHPRRRNVPARRRVILRGCGAWMPRSATTATTTSPAITRMWREVGWIEHDSERQAEALGRFLQHGTARVGVVAGDAECLVHRTPGTSGTTAWTCRSAPSPRSPPAPSPGTSGSLHG